MEFTDRVVLVTGAASGIGRALCWELGRAGARVGLIDRDEEGLARLHVELTREGIRAASAQADVRDQERVRAAVADIVERLGPVEILIPCAGVCALEVLDDLRVSQIEEILRINFLGVIYALDAVLPGMLARGEGWIVAMASMTAVRAIPFEATYGASKAALVNYLESLRPALRRRGVRVTLAYPGFVNTPLLGGLLTTGQMKSPSGIVSPELAARKIVAAIRRGKRVTSFPWSLSTLVGLARLLPHPIYDWFMTRMARQVRLPY